MQRALDITNLQCLLLTDSPEGAAILRSDSTIQELLRQHNFTRVEIVSPMTIQTAFDTKARTTRVINTELRGAFSRYVWEQLCFEDSLVQMGALMAIKHGLRALFWQEANPRNRGNAWTMFIDTRVVTADDKTIACLQSIVDIHAAPWSQYEPYLALLSTDCMRQDVPKVHDVSVPNGCRMNHDYDAVHYWRCMTELRSRFFHQGHSALSTANACFMSPQLAYYIDEEPWSSCNISEAIINAAEQMIEDHYHYGTIFAFLPPPFVAGHWMGVKGRELANAEIPAIPTGSTTLNTFVFLLRFLSRVTP